MGLWGGVRRTVGMIGSSTTRCRCLLVLLRGGSRTGLLSWTPSLRRHNKTYDLRQMGHRTRISTPERTISRAAGGHAMAGRRRQSNARKSTQQSCAASPVLKVKKRLRHGSRRRSRKSRAAAYRLYSPDGRGRDRAWWRSDPTTRYQRACASTLIS